LFVNRAEKKGELMGRLPAVEQKKIGRSRALVSVWSSKGTRSRAGTRRDDGGERKSFSERREERESEEGYDRTRSFVLLRFKRAETRAERTGASEEYVG